MSGPFGDERPSRDFAVGASPAFARIVLGGRIGGGRDAVGPAVSHPAVHALAAGLAPALIAVVAQAASTYAFDGKVHSARDSAMPITILP